MRDPETVVPLPYAGTLPLISRRRKTTILRCLIVLSHWRHVARHVATQVAAHVASDSATSLRVQRRPLANGTDVRRRHVWRHVASVKALLGPYDGDTWLT